jgi:hypothetical protein
VLISFTLVTEQPDLTYVEAPVRSISAGPSDEVGSLGAELENLEFVGLAGVEPRLDRFSAMVRGSIRSASFHVRVTGRGSAMAMIGRRAWPTADVPGQRSVARTALCSALCSVTAPSDAEKRRSPMREDEQQTTRAEGISVHPFRW